MDAKTLISFLLNSTNIPVVQDPYWNDVHLLLRLDKEANSLGLPLYRDYSRYQYPVREWLGSSQDSRVSFLDNFTESLPSISNTGDIDVDSYCYIPNKYNHSTRLTELNVNTDKRTTLPVSYLEVLMAGVADLDLGTDDFTIEFSFFADEVNLPWRWQTIWTVGNILRSTTVNPSIPNLKTYITPYTGLPGWGCFLKDNDLIFLVNDIEIKVNTAPLEKLVWYHVALVRINGVLKAFINTNQTITQAFTTDLTSQGLDSFHNRLRIGASQLFTSVFFSQSTLSRFNMVDASFSGGLSNFRITKNSRYAGNFYTLKLPHNTLANENKIDTHYTDTLFNLPISYDFYNYASNHAHFSNREYLKGVPNFQTGFLPITGVNSYQTNSAGVALSDEEWTVEFFICPTLDNTVEFTFPRYYSDVTGDTSFRELTFKEWLEQYRVRTIANADFFTPINLLSLTSNSKKVLDINLNFVGSRTVGSYFAVKASINGEDWIDFAVDEDINWNEGTGGFGYYPYVLPNDEIKFYPSYLNGAISVLPQSTDILDDVIPSGYNPKPKHIAISKYNNLLYLLVDGEVIKSVPFDYNLYQFSNDLKLTIGGYSFTELLGSRVDENIIHALGVAIKGIRITNIARYSFVTSNDVHNLNSVQPLPLNNSAIPPSRARVLAITKINTNPSVSTDQVSWDVFLSQPVDTLVIADFTLAGTGSVSGYSLISLTKSSEYRYVVVADTGTGNGELTLNFIDRHTLKYKGTNTKISYFTNELDVEGETYTINKNAPIPYLTSGSSPYISNDFIVRLTFDAAISVFNVENIGIVNGVLSNVQLIDEVAHIYDLTIEPIREGLVIVQCMEGVAITDGNVPSVKSAAFVRIYSEAFPILQTPLNLSNTIYDLSPSRLILDDVIDNNVDYSTTIYPIGESSSLYVRPLLEQSGLRKIGFNAVASTIDTTTEEWTIEFFLRIDSSQGTRKAHILSVENPSTGFCVFCDNGNMRIQRSASSSGNLLGSLTMADKDTPTFISWSNNSYTQLQKFPHFAITYKEGIYRFYRNGKRVGLLQSSALIDISKGNVHIGYYPNRIDDIEFYLSNVRLTLGKALYTAYEVNVPGLPYTILPNITDEAELLNYISIYSNNENSSLAIINDTITLKFSAILTLENAPVVTILGRTALVTKDAQGIYKATCVIEEDDIDGQIPFSITIADEPGIPTKVFTATTNNSQVFIDNSPLEASITSDSVDDGNYIIEASISFTEAIRGFSVNDLMLTNCKVGNIRKITGDVKYLFTITAINTGDISVYLPANKVQDLAGNYNLLSNTFSRTVAVPTYVPDSHFDNVLLLIQPENDIVDESSFNEDITLTNVQLVNSHAPQGLTKSLYFNGKDSSLNVNLSSTLASNEPYTIEFFAYFQSNVVFRLPRPISLPANQLTTDSFQANWNEVEDASSYVIDVSKQANFTTYIPGFKQLNVGNSLSRLISTDKLDTAPRIKYSRVRAAYGFISEWSFIGDKIGYKYDVALDSNFTKKLYMHTNRLVKAPYAVVGDIKHAGIFAPSVENEEDEDSVAYNTQAGVVLTGLLSNTNYPKLYYFLEESTIRLYPTDGYVLPAVAEDIDPSEWYHIAVVNDIKYTYLYINGEQVDKVRNASFASEFDVGYDIGHFYGYLTGLRITKGIKRYSKQYVIPTLPYSKD